MLNLEQQVVSLDLSKKLKSLNVKQESLFYWFRVTRDVYGESHDWQIGQRKHLSIVEIFEKQERAEFISAFTVAELYQLHYEKFGKCYMRPNVSPEYLADYLAQSYIDKLTPDVI